MGAAAGAWPSRRGQGQGLAFASRRGRLAPPPPLPSGFPSRPPSAGPSCAKISVLCGRRRTLLRARPPPDSSPGAARRPASRSRPAPAARSRPLGGPLSQPGNVRPLGRGPALPRFSFLPLARAERHQRQFCSFPGSRDPPSTPLTLVSPALFLCWIPPESQNNWVRAGAKKEAERAGRAGAARGDREARLKGFPGEGQPRARARRRARGPPPAPGRAGLRRQRVQAGRG